MAKKPGPPKEFPESALVTFPAGTKERIKGVLSDGESERQFVREAVVERVEKRERQRRRVKKVEEK